MGATSCFGEGFPPRGGRDEYPIYWYLSDYAEQLKQALDKKRLFSLLPWEVDYIVKITRNGQVIPLELEVSDWKIFNNIAKDIILSCPPKPFGNDINQESLVISINLIYYGWENNVFVTYGHIYNGEKIYSLFIERSP